MDFKGPSVFKTLVPLFSYCTIFHKLEVLTNIHSIPINIFSCKFARTFGSEHSLDSLFLSAKFVLHTSTISMSVSVKNELCYVLLHWLIFVTLKNYSAWVHYMMIFITGTCWTLECHFQKSIIRKETPIRSDGCYWQQVGGLHTVGRLWNLNYSMSY